MDIDQAIKVIRSHLTKERFDHSLRVATVAVELANCYNLCVDQINLAAVLHDYAKFRERFELKRWIQTSSLPKDLLFFNDSIWHGPVGALMLKYEQGVHDDEILTAIRYHTTGRPHMTVFEKVLFVADYIEPARNFPGLDKIREIAYKNVHEATFLILKNMIQFLIAKGHSVYPDTFHAYNILNQRKEQNGGYLFNGK